MEDGGYPSICFYCGWQYTASYINQRCPKCHWDDSQLNRLQGARLIGIDPATGQPNEFFQKLAATPLPPLPPKTHTPPLASKRRGRGRTRGPVLVTTQAELKRELDRGLNLLKDSQGGVKITHLAAKIGWSRGTLYKYARDLQVDLWAYIDDFFRTQRGENT